MKDYQLEFDEAPLLKNENVRLKISNFFTYNLLLTNKNLILSQRTLFGSSKVKYVFSLQSIKVLNGQVQAFDTKNFLSSSLKIYFFDGTSIEIEGFGPLGTASNWVRVLQKAVTGVALEEINEMSGTLNSPKTIIGQFSNSFNEIKDLFKSDLKNNSNQRKIVKINKNCSGCGAPITGAQGKNVKCEFCGTYNDF